MSSVWCCFTANSDIKQPALPASSPHCSAARLVCSFNINVNSGQPRLNSQPTPIMEPQHSEAGCIWGRHSTERAPTQPYIKHSLPSLPKEHSWIKKKNPPPPWKLHDWVGCTLHVCVLQCVHACSVCTQCTELIPVGVCVSSWMCE